MEVSFYNFNKLHDSSFQKQILARFEEIVKNNAFVEGPYNYSFEKGFAKFLNSNHALLVANGTDAIEIALKAAGVEAGDKVAIPGITFYATAEAVINIGARPVLVDVDEETGLMCVESFKRMAKKHTLKAVIPVHIYGLPAHLEEIEKVCGKEIAIIEDAAQAHGAKYLDGTNVGSRDTFTTFSFYPTKNLSAFGDAGAISCKKDEDKELILSIRNHGRGREDVVGRNSRCDHLQAAVLDLKLTDFAEKNEARKKAARLYYKHLRHVQLLPEKYLDYSSWHLFPILLKNQAEREKLINYLQSKKIGTGMYYPQAMSQFKTLESYKADGEYEKAETFGKKVLCLPMHCFLEEAQIEYVANEINHFYTRSSEVEMSL